MLKERRNNMNTKREKFAGTIKEKAGKISGNEQLELKGKIQIAKAKFNDKVSIKKNVNKLKENVAGKINDMSD